MIEFLIFLFFSLSQQTAHFNIWTGEISCVMPADCLHEEGHALDRENGWISETDEFKLAVDTHRSVAWQCIECRDEYSELVMFFPGVGRELQPEPNPLNLGFWIGGWGGTKELYADIFAKSGGKPEGMPEIFRPFYDFTMGDEIYKNTPKMEIRSYIFNPLAIVGELRY
ncbi:MAG: hypothetical protein PHE50_02645 [Dehalococcoidales bacterium]|nr:hypothetical protein [Dehalococcoidales bacterium]MDD5189924.1 hypothetical protein [Dehalococcoidales bacterium]